MSSATQLLNQTYLQVVRRRLSFRTLSAAPFRKRFLFPPPPPPFSSSTPFSGLPRFLTAHRKKTNTRDFIIHAGGWGPAASPSTLEEKGGGPPEAPTGKTTQKRRRLSQGQARPCACVRGEYPALLLGCLVQCCLACSLTPIIGTSTNTLHTLRTLKHYSTRGPRPIQQQKYNAPYKLLIS